MGPPPSLCLVRGSWPPQLRLALLPLKAQLVASVAAPGKKGLQGAHMAKPCALDPPFKWASPVAELGRIHLPMQETGLILGREDS